jgi:hypothetical protein
MAIAQRFLLAMFLGSTPIAVAAWQLGLLERTWCAVYNQYAFALAMVGLYVYPLLGCGGKSFAARLDISTWNWILWLTVFTEVVFQIPHNLATPWLHQWRDAPVEWPFYAYGLADARWRSYGVHGQGLPFEVQLINWNDGLLGLLVGVLVAHHCWTRPADGRAGVPLLLAVVFRDATLFRETVEYLADHHVKGYVHTTADPALRPHGIAILWLVNCTWLVAPLLSLVWAAQQLRPLPTLKTKQS